MALLYVGKGDAIDDVGNISTVIRVKLTGRSNTPDLYEIMKVLGKNEIMKRI